MSNISCGIVGLPNAGKSTLYNALTRNNALIANYPFATIEPNTGVVSVPDDRLKVLAEIYKTNNIVPASVTFVDIAGLVAGAHKGEGLGNQFLGHIRSCQIIIHVVRDFSDSNVSQATTTINPSEEIEIINTELVLADLQTVDRNLVKFEKEAKADPSLKPQLETRLRVKELLNSGKPVFSDPSIEVEHIAGLQIITAKPTLFVFNVDESGINNRGRQKALKKLVDPSEAIFICAKLENELKDLDEIDRTELLTSYGQTEPGLNQLIRAAYKTLGLQSFLTAGEKEVRAWTIKSGSTAKEAAGSIHNDFARGFIAAEIVSYKDFVSAGSIQAAKAIGKLRTEGKDYRMQPDDIVEFRFNV